MFTSAEQNLIKMKYRFFKMRNLTMKCLKTPSQVYFDYISRNIAKLLVFFKPYITPIVKISEQNTK